MPPKWRERGACTTKNYVLLHPAYILGSMLAKHLEITASRKYTLRSVYAPKLVRRAKIQRGCGVRQLASALTFFCAAFWSIKCRLSCRHRRRFRRRVSLSLCGTRDEPTTGVRVKRQKIDVVPRAKQWPPGSTNLLGGQCAWPHLQCAPLPTF